MKEIPLTQDQTALVDDSDYFDLIIFNWCLSRRDNKLYAGRGIKIKGHSKTILMHRQILNAPDDMQIDHINGNGLDNRRNNLRLVTSSQNHFNQHKQQRSTSSRYKGVYWHKRDKVWVVGIQAFGIYYYIGSFTNEQEAALAYNEAANNYHGEYAKLNEI